MVFSQLVPHVPFYLCAPGPLKVCAQPWKEIRAKNAEKDAEQQDQGGSSKRRWRLDPEWI